MNEALLRWRNDFIREPRTSFDHLVRGMVPLGVASPLSLGEIFEKLFELSDTTLDDSAAQWLENHVLGPLPLGTSPTHWATILEEYFRAIATMELSKTAAILRDQHSRLRLWLTGFYEGPDCDPEGAYLMALARSQDDGRFSSLWRRLVLGKEYSERPYLGIGVLGFRKIPTPEGGVPGGLLRALIELAEAPKIDETRWKHIIRSLFVAYPRDETFWIQCFRPLLAEQERPGHAKEWLESLIPPLKSSYQSEEKDPPYVIGLRRIPHEICLQWVRRVKSDPSVCKTPVFEAFLKKHREYALRTGNVSDLSKNFNNLAMTLYRAQSDQTKCALELIREAWTFSPQNPINWTCYAKILCKTNRRDEAIDLLWEARYRLAWNPHIRTELAVLLRQKGDMETAEGVLREAISHFPNNVYLLSVLADLLIDSPNYSNISERLDEAERLFNKIMEIKDNNDEVAINGLIQVWSIQSAQSNDLKLRKKALDKLTELAVEGGEDAQRRLHEFPTRWENARKDPTDTFKRRGHVQARTSDASAVPEIQEMNVSEVLGRAMILLWQAERSEPEKGRSFFCAEALKLLKTPTDTEMGDLLPAFVETQGLVLLVEDPQQALDYFTQQINRYGRGRWIGIRLGELRARLLSGKRYRDEIAFTAHSQNEHFAIYVAQIIQVLSQTPVESKIRDLLKQLYPRATELAARADTVFDAEDVKDGVGAEMLGSFLQDSWFAPCGIRSAEDLDLPNRLKDVVERIYETQMDTFAVIANSTYSPLILSS